MIGWLCFAAGVDRAALAAPPQRRVCCAERKTPVGLQPPPHGRLGGGGVQGEQRRTSELAPVSSVYTVSWTALDRERSRS